MSLLQSIFVDRSVFDLFQLLVRLSANRGRRRLFEEQRLRWWRRWRRRRRRSDQLTRSRPFGAPQSALFLIQTVHLVSTSGPDLVVLVSVVQTEVVRRSGVQTCRLRTVKSRTGATKGVIEAVVRRVSTGDSVSRRGGRIKTLGVAAVRVRVKATPDQGVGRHVAFAYERVTLENLDARGSSQNRGEERRVIGTGCSSEGRVQGEEPRVRGVTTSAFDVPHCRAVVQSLDREEPGDLLAVLVHVLQQQAVAPDAQPGVQSTCSQGTLFWVQFSQRFLDSEQTFLARVRHRAT